MFGLTGGRRLICRMSHPICMIYKRAPCHSKLSTQWGAWMWSGVRCQHTEDVSLLAEILRALCQHALYFMHKTKSFKKKKKSQSASTFSFESKILFFYISYFFFLQFGQQNISPLYVWAPLMLLKALYTSSYPSSITVYPVPKNKCTKISSLYIKVRFYGPPVCRFYFVFFF